MTDSTAKRFSYDEVFAAVCIFEEMIEPQQPDAPRPWEQFREDHGVNELRDVIIENLAGPCNAAWERAFARYDAAWPAWNSKHPDDPTRGDEPVDPGPFDWSFVPIWLRHCVDWDYVDEDGLARPRAHPREEDSDG